MNRVFEFHVLALLVATATTGCGMKEEPLAGIDAANSTSEVVCSYAPSQSAVVSHLSALAGGSAAATAAIASATGLSVVAHSSGVYILTGSGGYIAGTLGAAVAGPVIVTVSVLVGATSATVELLCSPRNHPELAGQVEDAAKEFFERSKGVASYTVATVKPVIAKLQATNLRDRVEVIEYARRKSIDVSDALRAAAK